MNTLTQPKKTLKWHDGLRLDDGVLDDEHRQIFIVVNGFEDDVELGLGKVMAGWVLGFFSNNSGAHFSREESLMRSIGYYDIDNHVAEHKLFLTTISDLTVRSICSDVSVELLQFLHDWIENHLGGHDIELARYADKFAQRIGISA